MPQNFIECDREQALLLPPSLRDWLADDHLAWFIADAVEEMDLAAFYGAYRQDGWGRAAFEPKMMVALLLYAYAIGERSSRGIERRCREDIAFRVLTSNQVLDHATIARFRARHEGALADSFEQALALCAKAGLVSVGVVAPDGSLISGNASPAATRSYPQIRAEVERMLQEAAATDEREYAELGERRGDELPAQLCDRRSRRERLRRCMEELEREQAEEQRSYEENLAWRAAWEAEHGRKLGGRKPHPPAAAGLAKRKINTSDSDTRFLTRRGGRAVQGYNAQLVASPEQVIVAADITQQSNDSGQLAPMVAPGLRRAARSRGQRANRHRARGWRLLELGPDLGNPRPGNRCPRPDREQTPHGSTNTFGPPRSRGETDRRGALHAGGPGALPAKTADRRAGLRNTKVIRRADRFLRRGLAACRAEWKLIAATHNLLKLWRAELASVGMGQAEPVIA